MIKNNPTIIVTSIILSKRLVTTIPWLTKTSKIEIATEAKKI